VINNPILRASVGLGAPNQTRHRVFAVKRECGNGNVEAAPVRIDHPVFAGLDAKRVLN
jgi:hypothetical protein